MGLKKISHRLNDYSGNHNKRNYNRVSLKYAKKEKPFSFFISRFVKLKSALAIFTLLVIFCGLLVGVGTVFVWLYGKAVTSDFFNTTHIDVTGNTRLSRELVLLYADIKEGTNSLSISIGDIERNLRKTPWVKEVSVKRLLPDRFIIKIQERMPSFWIHKDDSIYYANERGEPIAPVESNNFLSLPTLNISPGGENAIPCLSRLMMDIKNGALPIEADSISTITLNPATGIEIYLDDRELKLSIAIDDWEGNLQRMGATLADLVKRRELGYAKEIRAVDNNVWILQNTSRTS